MDELLRHLTPRQLFTVVGLAIWGLVKVFQVIRAAARSAATPVRPKAQPTKIARGVPAAAKADPLAMARKGMEGGFDALLAQCDREIGQMRLEPRNLRFVAVLDGFVRPQVDALRTALDGGAHPADLMPVMRSLRLIVSEVEKLAEQRRDPDTRDLVGDADALCYACYRPIIAFAQAEGLPLTTAWPATQFGSFDLSIWTGFSPTSVAPIFLPKEMFSSIQWWPALAHEIGHDFLASIHGLERTLARELGLTQPIKEDGADTARACVNVWFEEMFADVFGTMMCGPAYVITMMAIFGDTEKPVTTTMFGIREDGSLSDVHPPGNIRVLLGCDVLKRTGHAVVADELWARWNDMHEGDDFDPQSLVMVRGKEGWRLDIAPFAGRVVTTTETLVAGHLKALNGFALEDISGLDYGPHEYQAALRARDSFLRGMQPKAIDPRAIIAGAVLAWDQSPESEGRIMALARQAIPALDSHEHRRDAYSSGGSSGRDRDWTRDLGAAMVVGEALRTRKSRAWLHR